MAESGRYLTYAPWPGQLNNTRMCFETALVLAVLSRRVLVLPADYRRCGEADPPGPFRPIHPQDFLDFARVRRIADVLSCEEYCARVGEAASSDVVRLEFEAGAAVFCFPAISADGSPEHAHLGDFAAGRSRFIEFTEDMRRCCTLHLASGALEHFYSFFFLPAREDRARCGRLVRNAVRFHPQVIALAARIAAALAPFGAVHVRRNDFFRQYVEQDLAPGTILRNLGPRLPPGSRLYVATDERASDFFDVFRSVYDVRFLRDFASMIPTRTSDATLACLEQMICAFAEIFVGTRLSTFSGYITRLRGYYAAHDQGIHFTDGYPGSEADDHGAPPFSWMNWLRRGNPMWGREYREAWIR